MKWRRERVIFEWLVFWPLMLGLAWLLYLVNAWLRKRT